MLTQSKQHQNIKIKGRSIKCYGVESLVTCSSYLVVVGVGHIEQALFGSPGDAERMLQLGINPFAVYIPKSKKVLVQRRQKVQRRSNKRYKT